MPDNRNDGRGNDARLLTPLLLMGLIIVGGFLYYALMGHAPPASG
jgi:hypothetical protein